MTYQLRDYQKDASNEAVRRLRADTGKPFILVLATGAGKSLVIADICHQLDAPTLILQPSKEILEQNYNKLVSYGITDVSMYSASMNSKEIAKYTYATIQSIYKKPELFKDFKYVILDECHGLNPKNKSSMLITFLEAIECKNVCGLTATPYRLSQKYFWENGQQYYTSHLKMLNRIHPFFFKQIVYKIETADLIDQGYLSPILYRADREVDMLGLEINSTGADFTTESLEKFWDDTRLKKMSRIIANIDKHCQRNLIFCSSLRQARRCKEMLDILLAENDRNNLVNSHKMPYDSDNERTPMPLSKLQNDTSISAATASSEGWIYSQSKIPTEILRETPTTMLHTSRAGYSESEQSGLRDGENWPDMGDGAQTGNGEETREATDEKRIGPPPQRNTERQQTRELTALGGRDTIRTESQRPTMPPLPQTISSRVAIVDGKTPLKERERIVNEFKEGKIRHMINVGVFTTGFDVPQLDCVVIARPTMSLALYYQMVGRGVRLDPERPDKKLRVYDLAGVVSKLGRVETIRVVKEADGWKDKVISEAGDMSEVPLFKFLVKKKMFTKKEG